MHHLKTFQRLFLSKQLYTQTIAKFSGASENNYYDCTSILCPQHKYIENYLILRKYDVFQTELIKLLNKNYYITLDYFNYIIKEMVLNNEIELAHQMLFTMRKYDFQPNDVSYSYIIEGYLANENFHRAYSILIEANLHNVVLDLEIFQYFLTQIKNEHHSFTTYLYHMMRQNFNPTASIVKSFSKLAYKFQNDDLLEKLEEDLNLLEYQERKTGKLLQRRLKNEDRSKKHKDSDSEKRDVYPSKNNHRQYQTNDKYRKNLKIIGNIVNGDDGFPENTKIVYFQKGAQDGEFQENSDESENSEEEYTEVEENETSESSEDDGDNILMRNSSKDDSDTEKI